MKKIKLNWIALVLVVSLSALLLIACGSRDDAGKGAAGSGGSGGGSTTEFEMADLGGVSGWSIFGVSSGNANEGTIYGILDMNTSGLVLGGGYAHSGGAGPSADFIQLGATITINETTGVLGGTADTDLPSTITVASGKMNASKNVFTFVASTDVVEEYMVVAMKNVITGGEEYEDDDLDEFWYLFGVSSGGTNEGYIRGWISMDDEGDATDLFIPVTGGSFTHSDTTVTGITGGGITTTTGGRLSGTITTNVVTPITVTYGKMNLAKDALSIYATDASDNYMLVAIKQVGGDAFTESDLEGTWYISGASSGGTVGTDGTIRGTIILEAGDSGIANVTGGTYTHSNGTAVNLTGGTFPINGEGELSAGNTTPFIITDGALTITVIAGKMNNAKDVISYVATTSAGGIEMVFAVKGDTIL